jgi:hypothetical protein
VHIAAFDDPAVRATALVDAERDTGVGHAALRLHP